MTTARIYRYGALSPATYTGKTAENAARADNARPSGRPGRVGSLYASPELFGIGRWIRCHAQRLDGANAYEVVVDPDTVYVYSVNAWEDYAWAREDAYPHEYWGTGMTLTEWRALEGMDPREWEVLFRPEHIQSSSRVSATDILTEDGGRTSGLEKALARLELLGATPSSGL